MAKVPSKLELADVQASFRDLHKRIDDLTLENVDLQGHRVVNAQAAQGRLDYTTLEQVQRLLAESGKASASPTSAPDWGARIQRSSGNISIATSTYTDVTFTVAIRDVHGLWSAAAPTRLNLRRPGWWICGAQVQWVSQGSGVSYRVLQISQSTVVQLTASEKCPDNGNPHYTASTLLWSDGTSYITCRVWQNSGDALDLMYTANTSPVLWAHFLSGS